MSAAAVVGAMIVVMFILMQLYRRYRQMHYDVLVRDVTKGHRWVMVDIFQESTMYCNIGNYPIKHGAKCDSCGICVDDANMKEANKKIPCKPSAVRGEGTAHQWVKGNLPMYSLCCVCKSECGTLPEICDRRCVWCKETVHDDCVQHVTNVSCDFGKYRQVIVPPHCLELKKVGIQGRRHLVVAKATQPNISNWQPLIVLGNRQSGNNEGEVVLCAFRDILNPAQVIDLHDMKPENALEWCHLLPNVVFRIVVCGGDGSVGWVLNAIENLKLKTTPEVGILPLGTGNDLARVLGWGEGHDPAMDINEVVDQIIAANPVHLDRWKISINHKKHMGMSRPKKEIVMNNYVSIGVDALVTLNFHKSRQSRPWLFANRLINKMLKEMLAPDSLGCQLDQWDRKSDDDDLTRSCFNPVGDIDDFMRPVWTQIRRKLCYVTYGTKDCLERECKNLHEKIKCGPRFDGAKCVVRSGSTLFAVHHYFLDIEGVKQQKIKVELDGEEVELTDIEGLVVLNIASWGGGCRPWELAENKDDFMPARYDDGLLEVLALYSSFHIAQLQVGMASPLIVGQARTVKITLDGSNAPMQVDGEPWEQHPAEITVRHHRKSRLLARTPQEL